MKIKNKTVFSLLLFLTMVMFLLGGIHSAYSTNDRKSIENLENAITQAAVHCYAVEGRYPENLDYLKKHYSIQYDEEKFLVKYEIVAKNLRPQIRVIKQK